MIRTVGIVGAGTMGAGIMINSATHGMSTVLYDLNQEVLDRAEKKLSKYLGRQVEKERLTAQDAKRVSALVTCSKDLNGLSDCDLVIEAVFEDLSLKQSIFADLETVVRDDTILATNTSCLRLADVGKNIAKPDRFCGMHYFSPAEINPVVELIAGAGTSPDVLSAASAFLATTRKQEIPCQDRNGFALNRFFCPYMNEAVRVLDEGLASAGQIDAIAMGCFGLALGPFAVMNIVGLPTSMKAQQSLSDLGPFYTAAPGLVQHGEANESWAVSEGDDAPSANVVEAITNRLIGAVLLPVVELLNEGTASLESIDKGAEMAFRFVKTPGLLMRERGLDEVNEMLKAAVAAQGHPASIIEPSLWQDIKA